MALRELTSVGAWLAALLLTGACSQSSPEPVDGGMPTLRAGEGGSAAGASGTGSAGASGASSLPSVDGGLSDAAALDAGPRPDPMQGGPTGTCGTPSVPDAGAQAIACTTELCRAGSDFELRAIRDDAWVPRGGRWGLILCSIERRSRLASSEPRVLRYRLTRAELAALPRGVRVALRGEPPVGLLDCGRLDTTIDTIDLTGLPDCDPL